MQPQSSSARSADGSAIAVPDEGQTGISSSIVSHFLDKIWPVLTEWMHRWRARRELRAMNQREIADFCPKLTDALHEAEKPFWRP
jgi:uncharacterized protein YjiS (DUF1127 family)